MKSSELFSHPYQPETAYDSERDSEPVQAPVFSDMPTKDSTASAPTL